MPWVGREAAPPAQPLRRPPAAAPLNAIKLKRIVSEAPAEKNDIAIISVVEVPNEFDSAFDQMR
ncbi:hypothetical protein JYU34_002890 [Plutella xylostella]|uniref:Uncharacterized protein n=1 Tax=Plutella xylostella TaxID=51655 RepID=A0ABQ7R3C8_PLUXY|nr:hypothetical protein JYU34_002890 [Plutella xylostella]